MSVIQIVLQIATSAVARTWIVLGTTIYGYLAIPIAVAVLGWYRSQNRLTWVVIRNVFKNAFEATALVWIIVFSIQLYRAAHSFFHPQMPIVTTLWEVPQPKPSHPSQKPTAPRPTSFPCSPDASLPYKCKSNAQLGQWMIDEAAAIHNLADESVKEIVAIHKTPISPPVVTNDTNNASERTVRWRFTEKMKACCLDDMKAMRVAALDRLGPKGKNLDEQRRWDLMMSPLDSQNLFKWMEPGWVYDYAPYLDAMGRQVKELPDSS